MPQDLGELAGSANPSEDELPFFVLMQDDGLLSKITSVSDELLQLVLGSDQIERNDARVIIDVNIRPNFPNNANLIFFSDDFELWNHQWASSLENIFGWSNSELKARTTQCVLRMHIAASNFRMQRKLTSHVFQKVGIFDEERAQAWRDRAAQMSVQHEEQQMIWNSGLRQIALALLEELQRRVFGQPPYPAGQSRMWAIEFGSLVGPDPIGEAAAGLESLMRQLP
jgi:hypothetical protein